MDDLRVVEDTSFDTLVVDVDGLTLVAFVASWCDHCIRYKDVLRELAEAVPYLDVYVCDIDSSPVSKNYYDIQATPTSVLFMNGREIGQLRSAQDLVSLLQFIDNSLKEATGFRKVKR